MTIKLVVKKKLHFVSIMDLLDKKKITTNHINFLMNSSGDSE